MNKNFEQMLRLVDYVDGLMVVDKNCIIRHYYTAYPDLVNLRQDEPLNRSLFEIYPSLKREDSYICRALETGESFINYEQTYINYKGDSMEANCSAVPIKEHGEVVGVIDMVIYKDAHVTERRLSFDISLISALTKSYNTSDQSLEDIVTQDGEMIRIKEKILQTADSDAHVLVYGKTGTGKELITVRGSQVDQWVEKHVTFSDRRPKLSKPTGSSQSAYRHGRQDGARQAIGLKETGKVADWALEK